MQEGRATAVVLRITAILVGVVALLVVPGASGATWSAPQSISGLGTNVSQIQIAGTSNGSSLVVWKRDLAGFDVVQGTRVAINGTAGPVMNLSALTLQATDPVVAVRDDGSAMVAWLNTSATDDTVQSVSIGADNTVGAITTRSTVGPPGQPASDISIALGDDGTSGMSWRKFNGANWIVQGLKVGVDGAGGTIHDLSTAGVDSGEPDIAYKAAGTYRAAWPQGTGAEGNVGSVLIDAADAVSPLYLALSVSASNGTGGNPQDVQVSYGNDNTPNLAWVRDRTDDPNGTPYVNRAAELVRPFLQGNELQPAAPSTAVAMTPTVRGVPYNVDQFEMFTPIGAQPMMVWRHDFGDGTYRIESGRVMNNGPYQSWANATGIIPDVSEPVIVGNARNTAVVGWAQPGASNSAWSRFSNSSFDAHTQTGFDNVNEVGFAQSNSGVTLAVMAVTSLGTTDARVSTFSSPGVAVDPSQHNFGKVNIGVTSQRSIVVRSTGQTPTSVTGVDLGGANPSQFQLFNQSSCIREIDSQSQCTFNIRFIPQSAGSKSATVTVHTPLGDRVTQLVGTGGTGTRLKLTAKPRNRAVRRGKVVPIRVTVRNIGGVAANNTRLCANLNRRVLKLNRRCVQIGSFDVSARRQITFRVRVTWRAKKGRKYPVKFRLRSGNSIERVIVSRLRRKGN